MSRAVADAEVPFRDLLGPRPARPGAAGRDAARPRRIGRVRAAVRFARIALTTFSVTIVASFFLGLTLPVLAGYHSFTVMSGSMEPTIHTGDVVVDQQISPADARVGDIVTFQGPTDHSKLITHRVRSIEIRDGVV